MKKDIGRCMGCMSEKLYDGPCEVCGYTDNDAYPSDCLAPGTFLNDRYVIGRLIAKSGDSMLYLAFDTKENKIAEIREFMPDTLCRRAEDHESINVTEGSLPLFKSYLSEYADLHRMVIDGLGGNGIKRDHDIFAANGTGYVVTEHIDGKTLGEYIHEQGKLSWGEMAALLPTILDTLAALHEKGIVHRGLSPETILISKDKRPILTSVEISAARTADSRITCELFSGYAAPEQYDPCERQGSWTDIYGLCAVIYTAVTGEVPPDAVSIKGGKELIPAHTLNEDIPRNISDALSKGLTLNQSERIHDISALREKLFGTPSEAQDPSAADENDGPITPSVHVKFDFEEHEERRVSEARKKKKKKQKRKNIGTVVGLVLFLTLVIALVICIIYFSEESRNIRENAITAVTTTAPDEPAPAQTTRATTAAPVTETTPAAADTSEKLIIPEFVNRFYNSSLRSRYSMLEFETTEEYSDEFAEGIIMEQDIPQGTEVVSGTVINLKISKGAAFVRLPDYIGLKLSQYTDKLTELGIKYETEAEETTEVKKGYVVRCSKEIDDKIMTSEDETVIVYYAVAPKKEETRRTERETEIPIGDDEDNDDDEII